MNLQPLQRFCEIEEASDYMVRFGNLKLTQSAPGPLELAFQAGMVGRSFLYESSTNRPFLSVGSRSTSYVTISPMTQGTLMGRFRGHAPRLGQVLLMDPGGDSFQVVSANQRQIGLSVPLELCARIAAAEHGCEQESALWKWNLIEAAPGKCQLFSELLSRLLNDDTALWCNPNLEIELAEFLVSFACHDAGTKRCSMAFSDKQRIVRQSIELMTARLSSPPSVLDLCESTGTTRRLLFTLSRSCCRFPQFSIRSPSAVTQLARCYSKKNALASRILHAN